MNPLRVVTYNCRSVKNSLHDVLELCKTNDIICLQEHWLLPNDIAFLSSIHKDFCALGTSSVEISNNVLSGRPYGGTGILFKKCLASAISIIESHNPRVCAIKVKASECNFMILSVYLPTDYGDRDSLDSFVETCAYIESLLIECDVNQYCIIGDLNCFPGSRFFLTLEQFVLSNHLILTDINRMSYATTYYSNNGLSESWLDHIICSEMLDKLIYNVSVLPDYIISDHRPLAFLINCTVITEPMHDVCAEQNNAPLQWDKASESEVAQYQNLLNCKL
jgi:exonuclease III